MKKIIAIIGGGPAGMMAAGRAGELGARVILLEKNSELGIKLLATGNGRCNLSNYVDSARDLVKRFGKNGNFLFSALHKFGVQETLEFFSHRGLLMKVEKDNRVFPKSERAHDVLQVLVQYLDKGKVEIKKNSAVRKIVAGENKIEKIILNNGEEIIADTYIFAVGGKSYPATGSTGDGFAWLKSLGHSVVKPRPVLGPIVLRDKFVKALEGLSLKDVEIGVYKNDKKVCSTNGDAIFTFDGLSGPAIFDISRAIDFSIDDELELRIDFFAKLDLKKFDIYLQKIFSENNNRLLRNVLATLVPTRLAEVLENTFQLDGDKKINTVSKEERLKIAGLLKSLSFQIRGIAGFERAMVTAGGVSLNEVDPKTLKSKLIDNLYFAGEILDLDGPTGGFNLQACWTTGFVAGESATLEKF
ncbi:MAG: NAD(P)/FAD-dependent oxidoreductase [Candidatus Magasanikbacteria bacterium]|nr:NAD(P)/FAD-dependent oxidoreductase [Candidatus Magasanikbacteria bacterium]